MGHALGNNYGKFYSFLSKPVELDLNFIVDRANGNGLGVRSVKGQGVKAVYMQSSASPASGNPFINSTSAGYCLIELAYNYNKIAGSSYAVNSPLTGANLAINASALTPGLPYTITSVGVGPNGSATIQPVADVAGSLASKYFSLYDSYGNVFIIWFSVSGVGSAPSVAGTKVQQSILANATAAQIGAALVLTIQNLPSGISGVFSFTAAGTTTVTVTSTVARPLAGIPQDGVSPLNSGFAFALVNFSTNLQDWQHVGVPQGVVPAVGVSFVALLSGYSTGGGSSGLVKLSGVSGIQQIEVIGDPNLSLGPIPMGGSPNTGSFILIQFLAPTPNTTHMDFPMIPTAPADGSVITLNMLLEQATPVGGNSEA